jgi:L-fuconate dehydratase
MWQVKKLVKEAIDTGLNHIKIKVGSDLEDDIARCKVRRLTSVLCP